jgi:hypothetical protein
MLYYLYDSATVVVETVVETALLFLGAACRAGIDCHFVDPAKKVGRYHLCPDYQQ